MKSEYSTEHRDVIHAAMRFVLEGAPPGSPQFEELMRACRRLKAQIDAAEKVRDDALKKLTSAPREEHDSALEALRVAQTRLEAARADQDRARTQTEQEYEDDLVHLVRGARELAQRIGRQENPSPTDWSWMQHEHGRQRRWGE